MPLTIFEHLVSRFTLSFTYLPVGFPVQILNLLIQPQLPRHVSNPDMADETEESAVEIGEDPIAVGVEEALQRFQHQFGHWKTLLLSRPEVHNDRHPHGEGVQVEQSNR